MPWYPKDPIQFSSGIDFSNFVCVDFQPSLRRPSVFRDHIEYGLTVDKGFEFHVSSEDLLHHFPYEESLIEGNYEGVNFCFHYGSCHTSAWYWAEVD